MTRVRLIWSIVELAQMDCNLWIDLVTWQLIGWPRQERGGLGLAACDLLF